MNYYGKIEEADTLIGNMGVGVDYYKGETGAQGIPGKDGADGKTPVKGVDYFTDAEIEAIEQGAADKVDTAGYAKSADLSTVATSGSYEDLTNKPNIPDAYELPVASATTLGGVKVGSGLDITNGVLSATGGGVADAVDWSKVQNKPEFADVATSGDYNDLSNKPTIPSVEGLASEAYVNEKVAAIVIPEVPTKVSELENDKGYLTEHQSLEGYAKTAELAQVAKTGSYNDLSDKPTIPSTAGLASTKYVDDKVAGIVIPEVPTKVSAFENDKGYLTEHQSLAEYAKKTEIPTVPTNISAFTNDAGYLTEHQSLADYALKSEIPAPYTLPTASTSTLGGVKVDGNTITIADGVISAKGGSGGAEPDAYIKDASVSGNTLTLTKKDDTNVVFTPSGGSGGSSNELQRIFNSVPHIESVVSQNSAYIGKIVYAYGKDNQYLVLRDQKFAEVKATKDIADPTSLLSSSQNFSKNKDWVLQWVKNNSYNVTVNNYPVFYKRITGSQVYYYWMDGELGCIKLGYINFTDNTLTELQSYDNQQKYNQSEIYFLTSNNWQSYIPNNNWQETHDQYDSNLYNAKELVISAIDNQARFQMGYFNFSNSQLGDYNGNIYYLGDQNNNPISWQYNGSSLEFSNYNSINHIFYKT